MLRRTLSTLILLLAVICGAVLLLKSPQYLSPDTKSPTVESFPSGILSRFNLLPGASRPAPIAIVIENHEDARRYHEGLTDALMVQEYLVEGFISRFIALFDARRLPREIGPVRSLRPYFLDGVFPWARTVFHAGGSPEALDRVQNGDEFYALNLLYFDDENGSLRKEKAIAPHDLFLKRKLLKELLRDVPERLLQPVAWPPFTVDTPIAEGVAAEKIRVNFFNKAHNVLFEYMPLAQKYKRTNGTQVSAARPSNVIVLEVPIDYIGEYGRLFMTLEGSGRAQVFHSGKLWEGMWSRGSIAQSFSIRDSAGRTIPMQQGQIWLMVLPTLERVSVPLT